MRSTGEVMGRDRSFGLAFLKAALGAGIRLPEKGNAFLSVHDGDKDALLPLARELDALGFASSPRRARRRRSQRGGLTARTVLKVNEGRPNIVDLMINGSVDLIVNTPLGKESFYDEVAIRRTALDRDMPVPDDALGGLGGARGDPRPRRGRAHVRSAPGGGTRLTPARRGALAFGATIVLWPSPSGRFRTSPRARHARGHARPLGRGARARCSAPRSRPARSRPGAARHRASRASSATAPGRPLLAARRARRARKRARAPPRPRRDVAPPAPLLEIRRGVSRPRRRLGRRASVARGETLYLLIRGRVDPLVRERRSA